MRKIIYILSLAFLIFACSSSSNGEVGEENESPTEEGENNDFSIKLYFPQENMLCNLGTDATPTESTVAFEWRANDSENYKITIENLFTGALIERETTDDIIPITIDRATPYKWFVEAIKGSETYKSDTWQFYNAGPGVETYAPFPAAINAPLMAENLPTTSSVVLDWTGNDVDNDIAAYDVYFGTNSSPDIFSNNVTTTEVTVSVSANTIYYWKIITKDEHGNTSDSGIYQFKVL